MSENIECDWPEDAAYENGSYFCSCATCGKEFTGHKRRACCKKCHNDTQPHDDSMTLRLRIAALEAFARDVGNNYDCDSDAHKYGTRCRSCEAKKILAGE